jgi:NAD(P)-dependent dehydrogenase (short-subunit alcohol dehydrogenase family)
MLGLKGKTAIVTGATGGIGAVIAERLAAEGVKVLCTGRNADKGEQGAAAIRAKGGEAQFVSLDLGVEDEVRNVVSAAVSIFGKLDIVVNNAAATDAAIAEGNRRITDETNEGFQRQFDINLVGPFWLFKYGIPEMEKVGGGNFVNISTLSAWMPVPGMPAYSASKAALEGLSRSVAIDYAESNIRSNCIIVGSIRHAATAMMHDHPEAGPSFRRNQVVQRSGTPEDIASMTAFLASDESSFLSGEALPVHGGCNIKLVIPDFSHLRQEMISAARKS